jgi:ketosteroid isomerase-like protein
MRHRETAERMIEAGNRFAIDEIDALCTEDVVVDMTRSIGPSQGLYRGIDEVRGFFLSYMETFDRVIATPLEMHERGDWIAIDVGVRMRGRGSGAEVEARGGRVYEFRDGRIAQYVQFQDFADAKAFVNAQP